MDDTDLRAKVRDPVTLSREDASEILVALRTSWTAPQRSLDVLRAALDAPAPEYADRAAEAMRERCVTALRLVREKWRNRCPACNAATDLTICENLAARAVCDEIERALPAAEGAPR